jgi:hypothetical protein
MSLEDAFILGNVRELLGPACDPQLRLVSKSCHAAMATVPREQIRLVDFLSSLGLFLWALEVLEVPWREELFEVAAGGGHLDVREDFSPPAHPASLRSRRCGAAVGPRAGASGALGREDSVCSCERRA